ncbi:MAG: lysophospholipid acyltransferase family protein [Pseudomonadota bacterium]
MKTLLRHPISVWLISKLIWAYMALCSRTIRWRLEGQDQARSEWEEHPSLIVVAWHSTIMALPSGWDRFIRKWPGQKRHTAMLISLSKDGEPVARAVSYMGLEAIRGSTKDKRKTKEKGGFEAVREALAMLRTGAAICITPDGPRGPAEQAQTGPVIIAQRAGVPILPYAIVTRPERRLGTWDRFRIPFPFTRGAIVFGPVIKPDKSMDREAIRHLMEVKLNEATRRAEHLLQSKK